MKLLDRINNPHDLKKLNLKELNKLATEIRELLIDVSTQRPIHLSSNLGVVEIAMGSLISFNLPKDKVFYDTGHQSYPHKILTGRKDDIMKIRQGHHISGFQSMSESKYDVFSTGHSGNALSAAQGMELASRSLSKSYIVPIVGDGAIANGESFEALNNIQSAGSRIIIVLNDNGMSISKSVGSLARIMAKIKNGRFFFGSEKAAKRIFAGKKATSKPFEILYKSYNWLEQKIVGKNLFQSLGYQYVGPVNGNDLKKVLLAFDKAK
jgi:1-deoxy-D-xylulose-5-phosphate synthase